MASKDSKSTPGLTLDRAVSELNDLIDDALDFQASELEEDWALAERYYNSYTDLEEFEGRSIVTKTEVRDAIRNTMPSVMRVMMQSQKPVCYIPTSVQHGAWVEQQADYVRQLFYKSGGYMHLYNCCLEAFKLKSGIMKVWWEPDPSPDYIKYTSVPIDTIEALSTDPLVEIQEFVSADTSLGNEGVELFDVTFIRYQENGSIQMESVPNHEFFISRNCDTIEDAIRQGVHGQQQIVTVDEAIGMGLDYKGDWLELDDEDPELSDNASSSQERRGYVKNAANDPASTDVLRHKFLLTECYVSYDLEGEGRTQLYRFYLGGTKYEYLYHERVQDSPYAVAQPIPIPHSPYGHSIADLMINEQDASTSLLRAAIDNAHASNDAKFIGDPTKIEFDDLMNPSINAPVRARQGATVQTVQVPFTAQGVLSVLQYLDQDNQNKVGITKAAQGLDPDAMQSTDKQAVMNTIMTSQGQTELMVRNIIETCLIRVFRLLLRLSIQHMSPIQMMLVKGKVMPVDTRMFDPDAAAYPNVGLGTASPQQKQAALTGVIQRIEMYLEKFGPNNPFTSYAQLYNALEDLLESNGLYNVERYFNVVTPQVEKAWAQAEEKKRQEAQMLAQQNQPMDPSKAFIEVEQGKRQTDKLKIVSAAREKERDLEFKALLEQEKLDLERDKLAQDRVIRIAEIGQQAKQEEAKLKKEQENNNVTLNVPSRRSGGSEATSEGSKLSSGGKSSSGGAQANGS